MSVVGQVKQDLYDVRKQVGELRKREQQLEKLLSAATSAYGDAHRTSENRTPIWKQVEDGTFTKADADMYTQDQRDDALQLVATGSPFRQQDMKQLAQRSTLPQDHPVRTNTSRVIGSLLFYRQIEIVKRQARNAEYRPTGDVSETKQPKAQIEERPTKVRTTKPGETQAAVARVMADGKPRSAREVAEALGKDQESMYAILYDSKYTMTTEPRRDRLGRTYQTKIFRLKRREHSVHVGSGPTEVREGRLL